MSISHLPAIGAALTLAVAATVALVPVTSARAEFTAGATPVSATDTQLGDRDSTVPAISRSGRYVSFQTESTALLGPSPDPSVPFIRGLVRKDLLTGALEPIAPPGAVGATSISAEGRYVLFETTAPLVAGDANTRMDVYLRDMTYALTDAGAYELVSSLDGAEQSPVYPAAGTGSRIGRRGFSLSLDGRTAVFWTDGPSNLPAGGGPITPRSQVFVRSLDRDETRLVTRDKSDPSLPGTPVPGAGAFPATPPLPVLSGDGTTVAWPDTNALRQVEFLPGEDVPNAAFLWRDVTAGAGAPTRRVTGISDPDDPACPHDAPYVDSDTATGPCYGPFASSEAADSTGVEPSGSPLSISDDGRRLAFSSSARRRPYNAAFHRPGAYVVDMSPGLSRKQATGEPVGLSKAISDVRPIQEVLLSGDGRHLVFTSKHNVFDGPIPVGGFQTGELIATNIFVLDLASNSVERATRGFDGRDYVGRLLDPENGQTDETNTGQLAVSGDAGTVAFQAADGNLFVGDANGVQDVQVIRRAATFSPPGVEVPPAEDPVPRDARVTPLRPIHPLIGYVKLGAHGVATLRVRVPAAGRLNGEAKGRAGKRRLLVGKASRRLSKATSTTLRFWPSRSALRALRNRAQLAVTVKITYRPRRGAATNAARRYTLSQEAVR